MGLDYLCFLITFLYNPFIRYNIQLPHGNEETNLTARVETSVCCLKLDMHARTSKGHTFDTEGYLERYYIGGCDARRVFNPKDPKDVDFLRRFITDGPDDPDFVIVSIEPIDNVIVPEKTLQKNGDTQPPAIIYSASSADVNNEHN